MLPVHIEVAAAARELEQKGLLRRRRADDSERIIGHVTQQLGRKLPADLEALYRERISGVGEFEAIAPVWNDRVGWRPVAVEATHLLLSQAVAIFSDGCGSLYGLDLSAGDHVPAVYFYDHEDGFSTPRWAAGSSMGAFLLLLAESDRAGREGWPAKWELAIDPDLERCPRAPAIWNTE
jgi:hypothetical protein